jgi:hypothetical protein
MKNKGVLFILVSAALMLALFGCGGGGGSSDGSPTSAAGGTGQVALMLTDGPAQDYDQILITIAQAELLPANDGAPVVIFDPAEPVVYDLLNLRQEDDEDGGALLTVADVPAGTYSKIRLEVTKVVGVKATVQTEFKLSSGKIDLNPRGPFEVEANATLAITLDIDCDKSIHISVGNQKNFRPVVFIDIERAHRWLRCPRVLQGTVSALTYGEDEVSVTGFTLTLPRSQIQIPVLLDEESLIIDDQGNVADTQVLAIGEPVSVRGRLQEGGLLASMVVVGDMSRYDGIVKTSVDEETGQFVLAGDTQRTIGLTEGTLILWGCNQELDSSAIKPGIPARVIAKVQEDGSIVAVVVLLRPHLVVGSLTAMEKVKEGYTLSMIVDSPEDDTDDSAEGITEPESTTVFMPNGAPIWVKGNGFLTPEQLMTLVACASRDVELLIGDPSAETPQALKVIVLPELVVATVAQVNADQGMIVTDTGATIHVKDEVPVMDLTEADHPSHHRSSHHQPASALEDIEAGDVVRVYAIALCPDAAADYEATAVIIVPPALPAEEE